MWWGEAEPRRPPTRVVRRCRVTTDLTTCTPVAHPASKHFRLGQNRDLRLAAFSRSFYDFREPTVVFMLHSVLHSVFHSGYSSLHTCSIMFICMLAVLLCGIQCYFPILSKREGSQGHPDNGSCLRVSRNAQVD